jgi:GTP cyclohydrolase I
MAPPMTSTLPANITNLTTTALSTTEFSAKSLSPNSFSANSLTPDPSVSNSAAVDSAAVDSAAVDSAAIDSVALDSAAIDSPASNSSISSLEAQALPASLRIRQKLEQAGVPFFANDNISEYLEEGDLNQLEVEVADKVRDLLRSLVIDIDNDHNTQETAERVARMYLHEVFKGRYHVQPKIASFPNIKNLDEVYTVGPISIRSACSHHLVPILGNCWIGIKPGENVIGLSKFARVADWVFSRPHIQEEAVIILADEIERLCKPKGLAILVKAQHYCMKWRGVKELQTSMINSVVRGDFRKDPSLKAEFFELVKQQQDLLST